ncbi:MAG: fumarylacetoacetase [Planctomycetota bacterium]
MYPVNETHNPELKSWVESANDPSSDFPVQNLPYCVFEDGESSSVGVGIGDRILNLSRCASLLDSRFRAVSQKTLSGIMALPFAERNALREAIGGLLLEDTAADRAVLEDALIAQSDATFRLPCRIGDYTDFYASVFHATNVGSMFRPNNPLLPNYKHIPIGYHGRASSVVVSGTEVRRPVGQKAPADENSGPFREPCKLLDYELEVGFFVAEGNKLGSTIPIDRAEEYLFGMTLVNDWSARDIQKWEYQPLGPFLAKSFATSISPWVVTMEALAPFRAPALERAAGDPSPLDYLANDRNDSHGGVDIKLEVWLASEQMRNEGKDAICLSRGNFTNMYWTVAQMLTHHSSNGCNLQPGDLMASGTVSGPERDSRGCLLELTWDGDKDNPVPGSQRTPIELPTGEERKFLADGDELIIRGYCDDGSHRRIGFGQCAGVILPAN